MPNYSLVINSKFRPFSYAELAQPVAMSTQAHQEIENAYGDLNTKASIWEEMANEQTDPNAYKMYKTYANDLKAQADKLAKEGLNTTSRRDMLNMRARYSKEITPIENAYTARANEIKEQTAGRAQGIVYEGDASVASLDRYLKDPAIKYRFANSQEGFKRLASAATAISKELREYGKGKKLDAYTNTWLQQHGYKSTEIEQAIRDIDGALRGDGNVRGTNVLQSLLANEMQTAGVNDWNTAAKMDYYNRVAPALYQAAGQTNITPFEDYGAKLRAQESMQRRLKALDNPIPPYTRTQLKGNPYDLASRIDINRTQQAHNSYAKYFDANGNLTYAGWKAYKTPVKIWKTANGAGSYSVNADSPFKKFMDTLNGGKPIVTNQGYGKWAANRFGKLYRDNSTRLANSGTINADVLLNTAFDLQFDNQDDIKMALTSGVNNGIHKTMKYTKEGYKNDTEINLNDSKFKDATYAGEYGLQGNFIVITTKDNTQYRIPLKTVHKSLDRAITESLYGARSLYYKSDGKTRYSDEDLDAIINTGHGYKTRRDIIYNLINSARDNFTASFEKVKPKSDTVLGGLH